jgi:hypothetical protein
MLSEQSGLMDTGSSPGKVKVIWWWWQDWRWINQISKTDYADYMGWLTTRENFGRFSFSIFVLC